MENEVKISNNKKLLNLIIVFSVLLVGFVIYANIKNNIVDSKNDVIGRDKINDRNSNIIDNIDEDNNGDEYNSGNLDEDGIECISDSDCVPAICCHASSCVPVKNAQDCSEMFCTMECVEDTLDCGQGSCLCVNGKCNAIFK